MQFSNIRRGRTANTRRNVVAGILLSVLAIGLLLSFINHIQRIPDGGARAKSANNLKQLVLAMYNFEFNYGRMPPLFGGGSIRGKDDDYFIAGGAAELPDPSGASSHLARVRGPLHVFLLPYIEQDTLYKAMYVKQGEGGYYSPGAEYSSDRDPRLKKLCCYNTPIAQLISPNDPSHFAGLDEKGRGITSYSANAQLFAKTNRQGLIEGELTGTSGQFDRGYAITQISDGSSNTIAFSEKYGSCGNGGSLWSAGIAEKPIRGIPTNTANDPYYWPIFGLARDQGAPNRAYGADPSALANPADSRIRFQLQPNPFTSNRNLDSPEDVPGCDAFRASTPYASGILVGMADGSTRTIKKTVDPQLWFYMLHPDDGVIIDWD